VQFGNEEAIAENQQFMQDFKAMRFNWTPNGIQTLRQEALSRVGDDYLREHLGLLDIYLKKHASLKSHTHKNQKWEDVEDVARKIEKRLATIGNP
jgi:hypothetical protein